MRRLLRWLARLLFAALAALLLLVNLRLYARDPPVLPSLRFVGRELRAGAGERMQRIFPEGYFFGHVLYGLAWTDLAWARSELRDQAAGEAAWALARLEGDEGRAPFRPGTLDPPLGIFYAGWTGRLRGALVELRPGDAALVARHEAECDAIAAAFARAPTPFLDSYPGQAWPVDNVVAVATLAQHDRLLPPRFAAAIAAWSTRARATAGGPLLPHRALAGSAPQGSSQSLIQRFLPEIDVAWSDAAWAEFTRQLLATPAGVPGIREHAGEGSGNIDSGPLVFGVSPSATVVTIGAARAVGDERLARALTAVGEAAGLPFTRGGERRYGLGLLPVGDAFVAWSHAARPRARPPLTPATLSSAWRLPLHGLSLLLLVIVGAPFWIPLWRRRHRRASSRHRIV